MDLVLAGCDEWLDGRLDFALEVLALDDEPVEVRFMGQHVVENRVAKDIQFRVFSRVGKMKLPKD